ncbi:hypothetical protein yaldo0001_6610 [Yersinia aldovae ATCC 35236]|nr:hypothetical protein yaldo0001_6610 [Yersinia aldovae ATCC 35236]
MGEYAQPIPLHLEGQRVYTLIAGMSLYRPTITHFIVVDYHHEWVVITTQIL